jgi:hypothetical protein
VLETFLRFVTQHDQTLIAVSASGVVVLVALWIFIDVFLSKPQATAAADLNRVEASIEKFLAKAESVRGQALTAVESGTAAPVATEELQKLRQELEQKKTEVETLKTKASEAKDDNTPQLLAKIKDLEARLGEYEIIEDDIADLSKYKEENEKLKKQLASLGAAPAAVPAAAPLVEDFSKTVDEMKSEIVTPTVAVPEAPVPAAAPSAAAVATPAVAAPTQDVFAEYKDEASGDGADPLAELGDVDTSKMLEELQGLDVSMGSAEVLNESPDVDKMSDEAKTLATADAKATEKKS